MSASPTSFSPPPPTAWGRLVAAAGQALRRSNPISSLSRAQIRLNLAKAAGEHDQGHFFFCLHALQNASRAAGLAFEAPEAMDAAMESSDPSRLIALLNAGACPDHGHGLAPIHRACASPQEFLIALINAKADLNIRDARGQTPLIRAAANGLLESVQTLLSCGADPQAVDSKGRNAASAALAELSPVFCNGSNDPPPPTGANAARLACLCLLLDAGCDPFKSLPAPRQILSARPQSSLAHEQLSPVSMAVNAGEPALAHRLLDLCPNPSDWVANLRSDPNSPRSERPWARGLLFSSNPDFHQLLDLLSQRARALAEGKSIQQTLVPSVESQTMPPGESLARASSARRL